MCEEGSKRTWIITGISPLPSHGFSMGDSFIRRTSQMTFDAIHSSYGGAMPIPLKLKAFFFTPSPSVYIEIFCEIIRRHFLGLW
jgi:hypothetical protein